MVLRSGGNIDYAVVVALVLLTGLVMIRTGCILERTAEGELKRVERQHQYDLIMEKMSPRK
jgi:hypothetical protein